MVDRHILAEKINAIEKNIKRVVDKSGDDFATFEKDYDRQDIVLFNLMQSIQSCIDIASHLVSENELGIASSTRDFFYLLFDDGIISADIREKMISAVGFRNLIAHEYARLNLEDVYRISKSGIMDIEEFIRQVVKKYL